MLTLIKFQTLEVHKVSPPSILHRPGDVSMATAECCLNPFARGAIEVHTGYNQKKFFSAVLSKQVASGHRHSAGEDSGRTAWFMLLFFFLQAR